MNVEIDLPQAPLPPGSNSKRSTVSVSKKLAWGAGAISFTGFAAIMSFAYDRFYSREEGLAAERNVSRIERAIDLKTETISKNFDNLSLSIDIKFQEQTRVMERKVDKILEFMQQAELRADRRDAVQDRRLENIELIVLGGKPKQTKTSN